MGLALAVIPAAGGASERADAVALQVSGTRAVPLRDDVVQGRTEVTTWAHQGLPIRGAFEVVRWSADGRRRVLLSRPAPLRAPRPAVPTFDRAAVRSQLADAGDAPEREPELVYRMVRGEPVLAWEVQLPFRAWPEGSRRTLWLSAADGELVDERENAFASRARVFLENPSVTPDPVEVTLTGIDTDVPGEPLWGPHVRSLNCVTVAPAQVEPWHAEGDCWAVPRMFSDGHGDFFAPLPDPVDPASGIDGDDLYAELSMYVHAEHFLDVLHERGLTQFRCERATMLANFRGLPTSADVPWVPLDNAYFTDQCDPAKGATMIFGQGTEVDFAFDADVIHHELGHGVVAMLTPDGLTQPATRSDGVNNDAAAINESIADYFAIMLRPNPDLAEYVGRFWAAQTTPYIRTAENDKRCPDDTIGESHADGEPLTAALWSTRVRVGEPLDAIVFDALSRVASDATLELFAAALLDAAAAAREDGRVDDDDVALLRRELEVRNLLDCVRVVSDPVALAQGRVMYLRKRSAAVEPFWPGPVQLRVVAEATEVELSMNLRTRNSDAPPTAALLVKRGATPIAFTYDLVARDDPGTPTSGSSKTREVTLVGGDWDRQLPIEALADDRHRVVIEGVRPGEVLHLAFVATEAVDVVAIDLAVVAGAVGAPDGDDGTTGEGEGDGDGDGDGEGGLEVVHADAGTASCACRSRGAAPTGLPWLLVLAAPLRPRRGRR
ncbi:MAG: M36 family metallopeptidase [Deltaproteobacteria bacterium]|nr:M36 family metallopeptidase [Deltaproteobacteria bacterium]